MKSSVAWYGVTGALSLFASLMWPHGSWQAFSCAAMSMYAIGKAVERYED